MEFVGNYKYKVLKKIGSGGFGYVEKIKLFNLSETCSGYYARKVLVPTHDLKMYKERFKREVLSQSKCNNAHVVNIYICNLSSNTPFFIMELAECDLQSIIDSNSLVEAEKLKIIKMICLGVGHIHKLGFLHRDIKPHNILKYQDGNYKISDFGLVRKIISSEKSEVLTSLDIRLGTENYVAPELRYIGNDYNEKTDIFAMGKCFELLQVQNTAVKKIITKCSKMDPENRYDSVDELLNMFELATGESS